MSVILKILIGLSCLSALFGFILMIIVYTSPEWLTQFYRTLACKSGTVNLVQGKTCRDAANKVCPGEGDTSPHNGSFVIGKRSCWHDDTPGPYHYQCANHPPNCNKTIDQVVHGAKIVMWSCLWGGIGLLFIVEVFSQRYKHKRDKHEFILKHLKSQLL